MINNPMFNASQNRLNVGQDGRLG